MIQQIECYPELHAFINATTFEEIVACQRSLKKTYFIQSFTENPNPTPLEICAEYDKIEQIKCLIEHSQYHVDALLSAFTIAAKHGFTPILMYLLDVECFRKNPAINNNILIRTIVSSGNATIFWRLVTIKNVERQLFIINNEILRRAIQREDIEIVKYLLTNEAVIENIAIDRNAVLSAAADRGNLAIFELILAFPAVKEAILHDRTGPLIQAVKKGHLAIVKRLLQIKEVRDELDHADHIVFRLARGLEVQHCLLEYPSVFEFCEAHTEQYGRILQTYIESKLMALESRRKKFELENPRAIFDIQKKETRIYYFVARYLIRSNQREGDEALHQVLALPCLAVKLHLSVDGFENNALLRLALKVNNSVATQLLFRSPLVRRAAIMADFYKTKDKKDQNDFIIQSLAPQSYEALRAGLSPVIRAKMDALMTRYRVLMDEKGGISAVFESFLAHLKKSYMAYPAIASGMIKQILPLEWADFVSLIPEERQRSALLIHYYTHPTHTAYRYFLKPNPYLATDALFVIAHNNKANEYYSTFEDSIPLIAYLWLAINDETLAASQLDREGYQTAFIHTIAFIARAYNGLPSKLKTDEENEYGLYEPDDFSLLAADGTEITEDDLKGDNPLCHSRVAGYLCERVLSQHPALNEALKIDDIPVRSLFFTKRVQSPVNLASATMTIDEEDRTSCPVM